MKEIIFFDIDGTLMESGNNELNSNTIDCMNKLREKDIEICLCTGRNYWYAKEIAKQANISNLICSNGTEIYKNFKCIYSSTIPNDVLNHTIDNVQDSALMLAYLSANSVFFNDKEHHNIGIKRFDGYKNLDLNYAKTLPKNSITKLYIQTDSKQKQNEILQNLHPNLTAYCTSDFDCEVSPHTTSKANGIKIFLNSYDEQFKTYAFGDGPNDYEMLQLVDHPVVMANADDKLKSLVKNIAPSVQEDGIVKYLKQINKI